MTTDTDKASDKLVEMALKAAFEKGWCAAAQWAQRDDLRHDTGSIAYAGQRDAILAGKAAEVRAAIIADLCGDVEPVAEFGGRRQTPEGTTEFWGVLLEPWDAPPKGSQLYSASTVAALKSRADALQARVDAVEAALLEGARRVESLKRDCGTDPESPIAIQNGRYMGVSHFLRAALAAKGQAS